MIPIRRRTYIVLACTLIIIMALSCPALAEAMICRQFPDGEEKKAAQFDDAERLSPSFTQNLSYDELGLAQKANSGK